VASMTFGDIIQCCLAKEWTPARVDTRSKYPENHSLTLEKNEYFFARTLALAALALVLAFW